MEKRIYESPLLKIDVKILNHKVKLIPRGMLSYAAASLLSRANRMFSQEKPISRGEQQIIFSTWIPPVPSGAFQRLIAAQVSSALKKRVPEQVSIGITSNCPNNCIHCSAANMRSESELELGEIKSIIDQALELGCYLITFDGGEPLFRRDLEAMIKHIDRERAIAAAFASGFGLTLDRAKQLKEAGLYAVRISLDSPYEKVHDRIRGRKGVFKDAVEGIQNAIEAGLLVDLFIVISPYNIKDLEAFYELASNLGVHELSFYEIVAVGRWLSHETEVLTDRDVELLKQFHIAKNKLRKGPRVTAFPYFMGPEMFGCFAGRKWIHITPSGEVLPCAYTPLSFGNVREEALKVIWNRFNKHKAYSRAAKSCLMRQLMFRERYIKSIPRDAKLPFRISG
ncbi:MAG: radical SAM protein [Methanocellales archaeon]